MELANKKNYLYLIIALILQLPEMKTITVLSLNRENLDAFCHFNSSGNGKLKNLPAEFRELQVELLAALLNSVACIP